MADKEMILTIELVPQTCWFSNVRSHVSRSDWDKLRKESYRKANHCCEICGGKGKKWPVECHEVWEYDDDNLVQRLDRLISLCPACHEVKHIGLAGIKGRQDIATKHLAKVNNISLQEANIYVMKAFAIWRDRSSYNWELDISWLDNRGVKYEPRT